MKHTIIQLMTDSANTIIRGDVGVNIANEDLLKCVKLIQKGYDLTDRIDLIFRWYNDIDDVPYAKIHSNNVIKEDEILEKSYKDIDGVKHNNFASYIVMEKINSSPYVYLTNKAKNNLKKALILLKI